VSELVRALSPVRGGGRVRCAKSAEYASRNDVMAFRTVRIPIPEAVRRITFRPCNRRPPAERLVARQKDPIEGGLTGSAIAPGPRLHLPSLVLGRVASK